MGHTEVKRVELEQLLKQLIMKHEDTTFYGGVSSQK